MPAPRIGVVTPANIRSKLALMSQSQREQTLNSPGYEQVRAEQNQPQQSLISMLYKSLSAKGQRPPTGRAYSDPAPDYGKRLMQIQAQDYNARRKAAEAGRGFRRPSPLPQTTPGLGTPVQPRYAPHPSTNPAGYDRDTGSKPDLPPRPQMGPPAPPVPTMPSVEEQLLRQRESINKRMGALSWGLQYPPR